MAVSLTEKATKQVKQLIQAQNLENVYLRMGVKGGGCSGMSYSLEFDNEIGPHDKKFEIDGVPVVCDAKSYLYLNGTTLDYVTQGLCDGRVDGRLHVRQSQREIELWLWHVVLRVGLDGSAGSSGAIATGETRRTGPDGLSSTGADTRTGPSLRRPGC